MALKDSKNIREKTDRVYQTADTPLIKVRFAYKQSASAVFYYVNHELNFIVFKT
jgi:hypothetical protein